MSRARVRDMFPGVDPVIPTGIGIDRYRIEPPPDDAGPRRCERHPDQEAVYVAIPVTTLDTAEPARVRGWTCPKCWTWTRRSFAVAEYELERETHTRGAARARDMFPGVDPVIPGSAERRGDEAHDVAVRTAAPERPGAPVVGFPEAQDEPAAEGQAESVVGGGDVHAPSSSGRAPGCARRDGT